MYEEFKKIKIKKIATTRTLTPNLMLLSPPFKGLTRSRLRDCERGIRVRGLTR